MAGNSKSIIERAALALFVREGFDAATTKAIAAEAGVSEGAIYRHFESKDALAGKLFIQIHRRLTDVVNEAVRSHIGIDAQAEAVVRAYCAAADEDWLLYSFHLLSLHRFLHLWEHGGDDPVTAVERIVIAAMDAGEIPRRDPQVVAGMALGVVTQVAQHVAHTRIKGPLCAHLPEFVNGVRAVLHAK
jgi:AcrR family transcriptional regulator